MSFHINTNLSASIASRYAEQAIADSSANLEKLSTGKVINSSNDDAAGLAVSERMGSEISQKQKVLQNLQNSLSFLQMQQINISRASDLINRATILKHRFISVEANIADKENYDSEFREIQLQLKEMQNQKFNGISLFSSGNIRSLASSADNENSLYVENSSGEKNITINRTGIFDSLFLVRAPDKIEDSNPFVMGDGTENTSVFTTTGKSGKITWAIDSFGMPDRFTIIKGNEVLFDEIYGSAGQVRNFGDGSVLTAAGEINAFSPIEIEFETSGAEELKFIVNKGNQLDPSNPTAVNNSTVYGSTFSVQYDTYETSLTDGKIYSLSEFSFSEFSSFSNVISNAMAQNGASQSRVLNEVSNLNKKYEKLELANSRITDTDFALEATKLARNKLLLQSSAKMIGTATNLTKIALKIMGQKEL